MPFLNLNSLDTQDLVETLPDSDEYRLCIYMIAQMGKIQSFKSKVYQFVLYTAKGVFQIKPGHVNSLRISLGMTQDFMNSCIVIRAATDAFEETLFGTLYRLTCWK